MKKNPTIMIALLATTLQLAGCATVRQDSSALFDLGSMPSTQDAASLPALPPISVAEIDVPSWLDRRMMHFRLSYADDLQPRVYSQSRWAAAPGELIEQRLKWQITRAGGIALPASSGATGVPVLRMEVQDFTQVFSTPQKSTGQVSLRASVFDDRKLVAQKTFVRHVVAPTADATGGAEALAAASDAVIAEIIIWLSGLPLK
jgi:cholesterol transport system auxiliary component